jgi:hypothetical protein
MRASIRICICFVVIGVCCVTSCKQTPQGKLIAEINAAKVKARQLSEEAERKRTEARKKRAAEDQTEHDKLIDEAAKLYGQVSDTLSEAADKSSEVAKLKSPVWHEEYFSLQAKLIRNLAQLATGAHEELLARKSGPPSESLVQSWKENIDRIGKENSQLRMKITSIESREGVILIKE